MTTRRYSSISQDTTLATGIGAGDTSMTVASGTGTTLMGGITLTAGDIFTVALDPDTTSEEIVYITARSSDTFTITRARAGTSATTHATGATVRHVLSSDDLNWFNNMIQSDDVVTAAPKIYGGSATLLNKKIMNRADTAANWTSNNPTLNAGEIGFESDTGKFKIGDGLSTWTGLSYASSVLPSQTSNGYKFLTTDGTSTSWANPLVGFNAQTGTTYTLVAADTNKLVTLSNASAITLTVPPSIFSAGQQVNIQQIGAGQVSIAAGSGVTITSTGATAAAPNLRAQYSAATIICTASNTFTVIGDLS